MRRKLLDSLRQIWKLPILEKMLVRLTINKPFGSLITKFPPNHYQYKKNSRREVRRNNINYSLDLSDLVDWYIYFGFLEESRVNLYGLMQTGQTVIDIGANVGDVTLHSAQIVGPTGKVHAFEPDPTNYKRLEKNLSLNSFANVFQNQLGLGDQAGTFSIANVSVGNQGMNRIVHGDLSNQQVQQIEVITLDAYVQKKNLDKIDVIKMDVEGFEYNVLKGSKKVIERFHPSFFIELDDDNLMQQGSSAKELVQLLLENGYEISHAESKQKINAETNFSHCHYDIVAKQYS